MSEARGHVSWFEVMGRDLEVLNAFYAELFGWKLNRLPDLPYALTGPEWRGVPGGVGQAPEGPGWATFYATVDDLPAALSVTERLGGRVLMPPMALPDGVTVAVVADPEGHAVGLWAPAR